MANHSKINTPSPVPRPGITDPHNPTDYLTVSEAIIMAIRGCSTRRTAAALAGISDATLSVWIARGTEHLTWMEENNTETPKDTEKPYVSLAQAVRHAEAAAEIGLVGDIRKAARTDWRAGAWMLPKRFGGPWEDKPSRIGVEVSAALGGAAAVPSHAEMLEMEADLVRRAREVSAGQPVLDVQEAR